MINYSDYKHLAYSYKDGKIFKPLKPISIKEIDFNKNILVPSFRDLKVKNLIKPIGTEEVAMSWKANSWTVNRYPPSESLLRKIRNARTSTPLLAATCSPDFRTGTGGTQGHFNSEAKARTYEKRWKTKGNQQSWIGWLILKSHLSFIISHILILNMKMAI